MENTAKILKQVVVLCVIVALASSAAPIDAQEAGFDGVNLHHIHFESYDSAGQLTTGAMFDDSGEEISLYLQAPSREFVWAICAVRNPGNDRSFHWFHPTYGRPLPVKTNSINELTPVDCTGAANSTHLLHIGDGDWHYKDPSTNSTVLPPGVYTVHAVGTGGDNISPFDGYSSYNGTFTITIIDGSRYAYTYQKPIVNRTRKGFMGGPSETVELEGPAGSCAVAGLCIGDKGIIFYAFGIEKGGLDGLVEGIVRKFLEASFDMLDRLVTLTTNLITIPHAYFDASNGNGIVKGWAAIRGLVNTLFVLALIAIAMANILRIKIEQYDIVTALPRLAVTVVAVNLSLIMTSAVVDFANVATVSIGSNTSAVLDSSSVRIADFGGFGGVLFALLLSIVALLAMLWLVLLLSFRVAVILFLVVIAPIGVFFYALPTFAAQQKAWQNTFFKFVIMGPVIAVVLWSSSAIISGVGVQSLGTVPLIIQYFVPLSLIVLAGMVPLALGGQYMKLLSGGLKKGRGWFARRSGLEQAMKVRRDHAQAVRGASMLRRFSKTPFFGARSRAIMESQSKNLISKQAKDIAEVMDLSEAYRNFEKSGLNPVMEQASLKKAAGLVDSEGNPAAYPAYQRAVKKFINSDPDVMKKIREQTPHMLYKIGMTGLGHATLAGVSPEKITGWSRSEIKRLREVGQLHRISPVALNQSFNELYMNDKLRDQLIEGYKGGWFTPAQMRGILDGAKRMKCEHLFR